MISTLHIVSNVYCSIELLKEMRRSARTKTILEWHVGESLGLLLYSVYVRASLGISHTAKICMCNKLAVT